MRDQEASLEYIKDFIIRVFSAVKDLSSFLKAEVGSLLYLFTLVAWTQTRASTPQCHLPLTQSTQHTPAHTPFLFTSTSFGVFLSPYISTYPVFSVASNTPLDLNHDFFVNCVAIAAKQVGNQSPLSTTTTLGSPTPSAFSKLDLDEDVQDTAAPQSRLSDSYPAAFTDFYGLPSNPPCIFKTGDAWPVRTGPQAQRILREARPVCDHPMQDRWLDIGKLIYEHLDSHNVEWSSIDPVRFAEAGKKEVSALYLWIGVLPGTLAFEAAKAAAEGCKKILAREGFPDIELAFRESVVTQSVGPKLLSFDPSSDRVPELRSPFTPALGIHIAPSKTPHYEGSGAIYLRESSQSDRVFLLTACHVARPPPVHRNRPLSRKHSSQAREEIVILGTSAYADAIDRMMGTIGHELLSIKTWNEALERFGPFVEGESRNKTRARKEHQDLVEKATTKIEDVNELHSDITKQWTTQRVIGYVVHAPAIAIDDGPKHFTRDWALIDLYRDKIDWDTFRGNKVYVGVFPSYLGNIVPSSNVLFFI